MRTFVLIFVFASLFSLGCESTRTAGSGLPAEAKHVGHGKGFEYVAPADGRMYRVRDGKVDGMRLIRKGDVYRAIGAVEGDDPTKSFDDFQFYFEPAAMDKADHPTYGR